VNTENEKKLSKEIDYLNLLDNKRLPAIVKIGDRIVVYHAFQNSKGSSSS
jgi:hypothetical protein